MLNKKKQMKTKYKINNKLYKVAKQQKIIQQKKITSDEIHWYCGRWGGGLIMAQWVQMMLQL